MGENGPEKSDGREEKKESEDSGIYKFTVKVGKFEEKSHSQWTPPSTSFLCSCSVN